MVNTNLLVDRNNPTLGDMIKYLNRRFLDSSFDE